MAANIEREKLLPQPEHSISSTTLMQSPMGKTQKLLIAITSGKLDFAI